MQHVLQPRWVAGTARAKSIGVHLWFQLNSGSRPKKLVRGAAAPHAWTTSGCWRRGDPGSVGPRQPRSGAADRSPGRSPDDHRDAARGLHGATNRPTREAGDGMAIARFPSPLTGLQISWWVLEPRVPSRRASGLHPGLHSVVPSGHARSRSPIDASPPPTLLDENQS